VGIATINTIGILGGFVGPTCVGMLKDWSGGYQKGMLAMAAPVVVAVGLMAVVLRRDAGTFPHSSQKRA